ncbi:hypothetical protein [Zooshikella harenae]|uniref:Uncharacterized protein n=1 Tax=Zooshikella harenae TaxID=2827238 RepID=A0ABS5ZGW5_9GAMM|nr:hypothetical protein [Zooshikella harenae]MBU2713306.1 hypothetical protein [Zooshikella harenae]
MSIYYIAYELHDGELDDYCSMDEVLQRLGAEKILPFMWLIRLPGSQTKLFDMIRKYLPDQERDKLIFIKPKEVCTSKALDSIPGKRALSAMIPETT